jgi:nucleoside-diphosphate-sugar epimerase
VRILILGGTSLTGPYAVRRLHELGHEVIVFHRGAHEADLPEGVKELRGDFLHFPRELLHPSPDVVVHFWAMTEADAQSFADTFRGFTGRAVLISSGDVYRAYGRLLRLESGPPEGIPLSEDAALREARYPYRSQAPDARHWMTRYDKILVEQAFQRSGIPVTILRYPAVCGPGEFRRFRTWLTPMLRGDRELPVQEDWSQWRWTHGFVEDVAESVALSAVQPQAAGRIYNVGEPHTPTMRERLQQFAAAAGWTGRIVPVPRTALPENEQLGYDFSHHVAYETTRIRSELGYAEVVPKVQAIERMLAWEGD